MQGHPLEQNRCLYPEPVRNRVRERSETSSQAQGMSEIRSRLKSDNESILERAHWVLHPRPVFQPRGTYRNRW